MKEASTVGVLLKKDSQKFCKIHKKTPVPESLFKIVVDLHQFFKTTYFIEHLRATTSE